ncbi:MAG: ERF family protein [Polaribacter sp.]
MNIHEKLSKIQVAFKAKKSRYNSFGRYNFRSAEDILEGLKPFIDEFNVTFKVDETYLGEGVLESKASISDGKDTIHASAIVAVDFDQKGMQMPQKFGSASSYGKKYSLGNLLLIDDTADADATNNHSKTKAKPKLEGEALKKAKEFIKKGGKIEAIKSKYEITPEVLKTL